MVTACVGPRKEVNGSYSIENLLGEAQGAPLLPMQSSDDFIDRGSGVRAAVSSFRHTVPLLALTRVQQSRLESLLGSVAHAHCSHWPLRCPGPLGPLSNLLLLCSLGAHRPTKKETKALLSQTPPVVSRLTLPGGGTKHGLLGPGPGAETGP
jgi:hypothetical protein